VLLENKSRCRKGKGKAPEVMTQQGTGSEDLSGCLQKGRVQNHRLKKRGNSLLCMGGASHLGRKVKKCQARVDRASRRAPVALPSPKKRGPGVGVIESAAWVDGAFRGWVGGEKGAPVLSIIHHFMIIYPEGRQALLRRSARGFCSWNCEKASALRLALKGGATRGRRKKNYIRKRISLGGFEEDHI